MEDTGIESITSRMQSKRSTNWAKPPNTSLHMLTLDIKYNSNLLNSFLHARTGIKHVCSHVRSECFNYSIQGESNLNMKLLLRKKLFSCSTRATTIPNKNF